MAARKKLWMQELTEEQEGEGTGGSLHRMLGFPASYNMGEAMSLLKIIKETSLGKSITNPLVHGKREITVTPLLKKRAVSAWVRINASRGLYKKKKAAKGKK